MTCCLNTAAFSILWQVVLCIDLSVFYTAPLVPPHVPRPPCRYFEWLGPKHFLLNDTSLSALCLDSATGRDHVSGSCCKWVRWTSGWLAVSWSEKKKSNKISSISKIEQRCQDTRSCLATDLDCPYTFLSHHYLRFTHFNILWWNTAAKEEFVFSR